MVKETIEAEKIGSTPFPVRESIKEIVSKMGPDVSMEQKKEHAKILVKIFEKEMTAKQAMNISDEEISVIYSYAYQLFNSGKYVEACELFKMLYVLDPTEGGFASALGACYHKLEDYETALMMFIMHAETDLTNPVPLFYCYDCFVHLNNPEGAFIMLDALLARAEKDPKYDKLKAKAELILQNFDISTLTELSDAIKASNREEEEG